AVTNCRGDRHSQQQIFRFLFPEINNYIQLSIEQLSINTNVLCDTGFPFGISITNTGAVKSNRRRAIGSGNIIRREPKASSVKEKLVVGINVVRVTHFTVSTADFQIRYPGHACHEGFRRTSPSERCRGKYPITVVFTTPGRSIATNHTAENIPLLKAVFNLSEQRIEVYTFKLAAVCNHRANLGHINEIRIP